MSYNDLIETAKKIPTPGEKATSEYKRKSDLLIALINEYMLSRYDLPALIGKNNVALMKNNHTNQVLFIYSLLKNPNPSVLVDTLLWVIRTYRNHGFNPNYWNIQLEAWFNIFKDHLSPETYAEITPLYDWIQINIPELIKLSSINESGKETTT